MALTLKIKLEAIYTTCSMTSLYHCVNYSKEATDKQGLKMTLVC